jgi:hypothetical protein
MGGPTLEDFRLVYEFYPQMKMVCIEDDDDTYKRQLFHVPCRSHRLKFEKMSSSSFLARYESNDEKSVFWLDYPGLEFNNFEEFQDLLGKVGANSLVKITLRCNPRDYQDAKPEEQLKKERAFRDKFSTLLPASFAAPPIKLQDFALLVQQMVQIAAQQGLPGAASMTFLPISSFFYSDGTGMFSMAGVVCLRRDEAKVRRLYRDWQFANLDWRSPTLIDVPELTRKNGSTSSANFLEPETLGGPCGNALGTSSTRTRARRRRNCNNMPTSIATFHTS